jgi:ATP-dependent protease ClpP protease subunit
MAHYIFYHGAVIAQGIRNLETLVSKVAGKIDQEIVVCICSGGGDVNAGIGAYNFLKMQAVPITTYAFGICGSIAATIFLAGEKRIAATACVFTLHAASYVEGPRKGDISENTELISMPFKQVLDWPEERISQYFGSTREQFLLATQAHTLLIATAVSDLKMQAGDEVVHVNIP